MPLTIFSEVRINFLNGEEERQRPPTHPAAALRCGEAGSVPWDTSLWQWDKELDLYLRVLFLTGRQPWDIEGTRGILFTAAFGVVEADVWGVWISFAADRSECLQWGGMWGRGHPGTGRGWIAYKYLPTEALKRLACGLAEGHYWKSDMKLLRMLVLHWNIHTYTYFWLCTPAPDKTKS